MAGLTTVKIGGLHTDCVDGTKVADNSINSEHINHSAALPDGVTATTQSSGDNSTKLATTAYVDAAGTNLDAAVTINESGAAVDFRVESDNNENMLFVDGSADHVGIGTNAPLAPLHIVGPFTETTDSLRISTAANNGNTEHISIGFDKNAPDTNPMARIGAEELDTGDRRGHLYFETRDANSDSAPTERMRITSTGNVQIGGDAESGSAQGVKFFPVGGQHITRDSNQVVFHAFTTSNSTPTITMRSNGTADFGGKITLTGTSVDGIQFGSTDSSGDITSQTLDDYEEGTFTPGFSFSGGNGTASINGTARGTYTKIGRLVYVSFDIPITKGTASGDLTITGMPFPRGGNDMRGGLYPTFISGMSSLTNGLRSFMNDNSDNVVLMQGLTNTGVNATDFNASFQLIFTGSYQVA